MMLGHVVTPSRRCSRCCLPMPVVCPSVGEVPTGAPSCAIGRAAGSPGNRSLGSADVASRHRREASAAFGRTVVSCTESETPTLPDELTLFNHTGPLDTSVILLGCPPATPVLLLILETRHAGAVCRRASRLHCMSLELLQLSVPRRPSKTDDKLLRSTAAAAAAAAAAASCRLLRLSSRLAPSLFRV
jgi:hypothetical protein